MVDFNKNVFKGEKAIFDFINPENYYTPLVEIPKELNLFKKMGINIFAKISWFNPLLNIKIIPAYWMLKEGLKTGIIRDDISLIEASSGNMAYSIKIISKYFGVKNFIALVSDKVSNSKRKILDIFGIKYKVRKEDICPDPNDPRSSINLAKKFREKPGWYNLGQYDNENNFWGHYYITGKQIYEQLSGDIDIVSIGLGTTGTLIGVSKYLKERIKDVTILGIIRHKNNLVPGVRTLNLLKEINFKWEDYVDHKIFIDTKKSYLYSLKLIRSGLLCGPSSGFSFAGLMYFIKKNLGNLKKIINKKGYINTVFICPDTFLPYIDEYFDILRIKSCFDQIKNGEKIYEYYESKDKKNYSSMSVEDLLNILNSNENSDWLLVDIRNEIRFKDAHIINSINIPYYKLLNEPEILFKDPNKKNIIFICDYDVKSEMLANYFQERYKNFNFFYLKGGISEWSIKNYPREGNVCNYENTNIVL